MSEAAPVRPAAASPARRLALGSAQFGLTYGVSNTGGQVGAPDVAEIVSRARTAGVDTIDTAPDYGTSEAVLGGVGVGGMRLVSKLPSLDGASGALDAWAGAVVAGSLSRLRVTSLHGLLLHRPQDLHGDRGGELYDALRRQKEGGRTAKVGVSVYAPSELDAIVPRFPVDIVQAPFNVMDQRLAASGWLARLADMGIEVHTRSAFLQGLLLMRADERPRWFDRWRTALTAWDTWLAATGCSAVQACLGFVLSHPHVHRVVVGCDSPAHMSELIAAAAAPAIDALSVASSELELLEPFRWKLT